MYDLAMPVAWGFILVLFRTTGLFATAPILSATTVPMRVRMAIAMAISVAIFSAAGMPQVAPPDSWASLAGAVLIETLIGGSAGLCAKLVFLAGDAIGGIAGSAAGLGFSSLIDPVNGVSSTVLGQLISMLTLGLAVAGNLHGEAIVWLARSVVAHPPGGPVELMTMVNTVINTGIWACALAVRLSFPFFASALMAHTALGVMGRVTTQLNLQSIGFSISLVAGGGVLYLLVPSIADIVAKSATAFFVQG